MRCIAALFGLSLFLLSPTAQGQRSFGTLTIVESEPIPAGPSPLSASKASDWRFVEVVYAPLFMKNNAGQYAPYLAESLAVEADGKRLVVTLKDGAKWSNGRPISAVDVVYTYELARIGKWNQAWIDLLRPLSKVEMAANGFDIVFELSTPAPVPAALLRVPLVRAGLHGPLDLPERQRPVPMGVIGAGPYQLSTPDNYQQLTINPNAIRKPRINEVRFVSIGDRRLAAEYVRLNGDAVTFDVAPPDLALLRAEFQRRQLRQTGQELIGLIYHPTASSLSDPSVRKAIHHLIRREELFAPTEGCQPSALPIHPDQSDRETPFPVPSFDIVEAERVLWWADWQREPHQPYFVRVTEAGTTEELSIPMLVDADDTYAVRRAAILRERLRAAGIRLVVDARPRRELESRIRSGEFPMALLSTRLPPTQGLRSLFHSQGGQNFLRFGHEDIDAALDAQDENAAVAAIAEHWPMIVLGFRTVHGITGRNLNAPLVQGRGGLGRVDRWWIQ